VSLVPSPEIEGRDAVEIATGRSTKRPSTLNDTIVSKINYSLEFELLGK
jgi:hypothetical protein